MLKKFTSSILFLLGFGIFIFTRMSQLVPTIPVAILVAPVFILRFIRIQPPKRGIWLTLLGFVLSITIGLWGLFDLGGNISTLLFNIARSALLAVPYFLPYLCDRLIYPKFEKGILSTLTFPIITTAIFFLSSLEGPFDGAVQISKFVYGPIILKQSLSLFGISSMVFVSSWLASLVNHLWESRFNWKKFRKPALIFSFVLLSALLFGTFKTYLTKTEPDTVKIAAVIIPENGEPVSMEEVFNEKLVSPFDKRLSNIESLTKKAALNEAKIVSFQEFAMIINEDDEPRLKEEYKRIAKDNDVYLSITYAYFAEEDKGENIHLLIDNEGEIMLDYTKRYLYGFADMGETGAFIKGPEVIQSADTPYGKIALSICRDLEFPAYANQAGRANVDIMLSPASEWPKGLIINSVYLRTIENGFSLVRPTDHGITIAADYNGNILEQMDSADTEDGIMYAEVPVKGVKTLYSKIGDLFGWICVLGFGILIFFGVRMSLKAGKTKKS